MIDLFNNDPQTFRSFRLGFIKRRPQSSKFLFTNTQNDNRPDKIQLEMHSMGQNWYFHTTFDWGHDTSANLPAKLLKFAGVAWRSWRTREPSPARFRKSKYYISHTHNKCNIWRIARERSRLGSDHFRRKSSEKVR